MLFLQEKRKNNLNKWATFQVIIQSTKSGVFLKWKHAYKQRYRDWVGHTYAFSYMYVYAYKYMHVTKNEKGDMDWNGGGKWEGEMICLY